MDKKLTITFSPFPERGTPPSDEPINVSIESSDPTDDINDLVLLLHSTLQSLSQQENTVKEL